MSKSIFAFVAVNVIVYLAFAFISWEPNASNWTEGERALFVMFGAMFGGISAAAVTPGMI
jgi:nitrous oxide reductase accessory protein NosL